MLNRVQHDKKKCVIPNLFRDLEFGNYNKLIAFALVYCVKNPFALIVIPSLTKPALYLIRGNTVFLSWIPAFAGMTFRSYPFPVIGQAKRGNCLREVLPCGARRVGDFLKHKPKE